jgi:hypothetical protein
MLFHECVIFIIGDTIFVTWGDWDISSSVSFIFNKFIEDFLHLDFHFKGVEGLPSDGKLDLTKLGLPALSMRVRTGRNLKKFNLPGGMSKAERVEMEI